MSQFNRKTCIICTEIFHLEQSESACVLLQYLKSVGFQQLKLSNQVLNFPRYSVVLAFCISQGKRRQCGLHCQQTLSASGPWKHCLECARLSGLALGVASTALPVYSTTCRGGRGGSSLGRAVLPPLVQAVLGCCRRKGIVRGVPERMEGITTVNLKDFAHLH